MRISASAALPASVAISLALVLLANACGGASQGVVDDGGFFDTGNPQDGPKDAPVILRDVFNEPLTTVGAYAVQKIYLGETDRSDAPLKDAWKQYGENLDGLVSTKSPGGECKRQAGADSAKQEDGPGGIDNSFGRTVLGFILGLAPTPSKTSNDEIAKGGRTMTLNLVPAAFGEPGRIGIFTAVSTTSPPLWDGTDVRAASASTVAGSPDNANCIAAAPGMSGARIASGIATGQLILEIPLQGDTWRIPINQARVTMTLASSSQGETHGLHFHTGTLSGVIPTEELVAEIAKVAGRISTQLCGGSTLDTIKQTIRQASDILVDGTQDPNKDCNGISIGIGFEATKITASGVANDPPAPPDPCAD